MKKNNKIRRISHTWLGIFSLILLIVGCGQDSNIGPAKLADPLWPVKYDDAMMVQGTRDVQVGPEDRRQDVKVILRYDNRGRDFREPQGFDGYVLWVTPLNREYISVEIDAVMAIKLYKNDGSGISVFRRPVRCWKMSREALPAYWMKTGLLDSYIVRLDWGQEAVTPGDYQLAVEITLHGKNNISRLFNNIPFEDRKR